MPREAIWYLENAREILRKAPIEDNTYTDIKPVQEACNTAYLAILKAIDEYLINKGVGPEDLPQSIDGYREMIKKYLSIHNGKLIKDFNSLFNLLHVAGYYRGLLDRVEVIKDTFKIAKSFIEKVSPES
ncbi:MAG: DUF5618 family protein [Nitrospirota bacterium]